MVFYAGRRTNWRPLSSYAWNDECKMVCLKTYHPVSVTITECLKCNRNSRLMMYLGGVGLGCALSVFTMPDYTE